MNSESKNKIEWFAAEIRLEQQAIEAVEFALLEAGASGTELDLLGKNKTAEIVSLVGYFEAKPDADDLKFYIEQALPIYDLTIETIKEIQIRAVENQDWNAEWKKHWQPTETDKFIVAPEWFELPETGDKIVVRIEPGMAFGTGTHETTRLCLEAIGANYEPAMSFFDVGTGTGILAIAVAKIQKTSVRISGCDTDFDSVTIARENAENNNVADKIDFYVGSINEDTLEFDFVAANVTADVIIPMLQLLIAKARKVLVLSGILVEQQNWVEDELAKLKVTSEQFKVQKQGEWISIVVKNA